MRISELTTDDAFDIMCEITPYISSIVSDESVMETIGKTIETDGLTVAGVVVLATEKINSIIPILLKAHRSDVYGILSVLNNEDEKDISKQNVMKTAAQIKEIFCDKELIRFFKSCERQAETE